MRTIQLSLIPGAIAGLLSVLTSWLWMGVIFHRFQMRTPQTWRPESNRSYALSIVIRFAACFALAALFVLVARSAGGEFWMGIHGALRFGALVWMAIAAPFAIESAIFINLHPSVVVGQVADWLTTSLLACVLTAWWTGI